VDVALGGEKAVTEYESSPLQHRSLPEPAGIRDKNAADVVWMRQLPHPIRADAEHGHIPMLVRQSGEKRQPIGAECQ
jgi:hypothetical protein